MVSTGFGCWQQHECRMQFLFRRSVITFGSANYANKAETMHRQKGILKYEFYQEYLFPEDEKRAKKEFMIWLVYNGVNYYAPFYGKEFADLILDRRSSDVTDSENVSRCQEHS